MFIRYIYYWNLQFLNNVIIDKTKALLPQAYMTLGDLSWFWLSCLCHFILLIPKLQIIWLSKLSILSVPAEGCSINALCALNLISMVVFSMNVQLFQYINFKSFISNYILKLNFEKIEGAIKRGQSRYICNIRDKTQNEEKQKKKQNTETYKMSNMDKLYEINNFLLWQYSLFLR